MTAGWEKLAESLGPGLKWVKEMSPGQRAQIDGQVVALKRLVAESLGLDMDNDEQRRAFVIGGIVGASLLRGGVVNSVEHLLAVYTYLALEWMPLEERRKLEEGL